MRIVFLLIVTLMSANTLSCQNIRSAKYTDSYYYLVGEIIFIPDSYFENNPETDINFCESHNKKYFINNLEIPEEVFVGINFKSKDITDGVGKYKFIISAVNKNKCVSETQFHLEINMLVKLNGLAINNEELCKIDSQSIIKIIRKRRLFREPIIEIITKQY